MESIRSKEKNWRGFLKVHAIPWDRKKRKPIQEER